MGFDTNGTKLANLVNPQVVADFIDKKLVSAIRFAPLCDIDMTLAGVPGNTVTVPVYNYIGDAADVTEGADISIAKLTTGTDTATIKKAGKGVQISDEAVLSGLGDPVAQAVSQLVLSIASKMETDILTTMGTATLTSTVTGTTITADNIADALLKFGEDIEGEKVYVCSPANYAVLRKATGWISGTELGANMVINGTVGMIHGCQVVVSDRLASGKDAYIIKPGALKVFLKRDTLVETDRDIISKSTVMTVDKHYVSYLYDASKIIKITHA